LFAAQSPLFPANVWNAPVEPAKVVTVGYVEDEMTWAPYTNPLRAANTDCIAGFIHSFSATLGLQHYDHAASLWVFFAACGVTELFISFLICTPLERFWPLTSWPKRNSIAADVTYAFFVRIVLFPLIAYFEYDWARRHLDGLLRAHAITPPTVPGLIPVLAPWPAVVFIVNFIILDLADYWRHRLSHTYGWWYGIHSLHHAEEQMTFWSDDRSHILEDAITYVWLITVGLAIGVPSLQFPFLILCFRLLGSMSHSNTRVSYGWLGEHVFISPQTHRTHHALRAAGRRSCNFGTALSWWDILFRTADFSGNTVETGDASAEPALVSGSWGEQQRAGFRRMIRLGRRRRTLPAGRTASC
jgi:sterol desaturase/sphingolipid hydroxylase (fatty acid hydroxylase superfamily)